MDPNGAYCAAFIQVGDQMVFALPHGRRYVAAATETALALAEDLSARGKPCTASLVGRPSVALEADLRDDVVAGVKQRR